MTSQGDSLDESPDFGQKNQSRGGSYSPSQFTSTSSVDASRPPLVGGTSATSTPGGGATPGSRMAAMMAASAAGGDCTVTYSRGGTFFGTSGAGVGGSGRNSLVGEGVDLSAVARLRRDVLERENQALATRLHDAESENAKKSAECERLQRALEDKDAEDEALRRRMMELEISHAQRLSVEKALETMSTSAAEAQAQALEASAQVLEAQAMAAEAEEKVAAANARAEAANRFKEEAINVAKKARAEAAKLASTSGSPSPGKAPGSPPVTGSESGSGSSPEPKSTPSPPKPVAADAAGGMAGFSPLTAARARASSSSQECDQLRNMLNDLSATLRKRASGVVRPNHSHSHSHSHSTHTPHHTPLRSTHTHAYFIRSTSPQKKGAVLCFTHIPKRRFDTIQATYTYTHAVHIR